MGRLYLLFAFLESEERREKREEMGSEEEKVLTWLENYDWKKEEKENRGGILHKVGPLEIQPSGRGTDAWDVTTLDTPKGSPSPSPSLHDAPHDPFDTLPLPRGWDDVTMSLRDQYLNLEKTGLSFFDTLPRDLGYLSPHPLPSSTSSVPHSEFLIDPSSTTSTSSFSSSSLFVPEPAGEVGRLLDWEVDQMGDVIGFDVLGTSDVSGDVSSSSSTSMKRRVAPASQFTRGSSRSVPFLPGGFTPSSSPSPSPSDPSSETTPSCFSLGEAFRGLPPLPQSDIGVKLEGEEEVEEEEVEEGEEEGERILSYEGVFRMTGKKPPSSSSSSSPPSSPLTSSLDMDDLLGDQEEGKKKKGDDEEEEEEEWVVTDRLSVHNYNSIVPHPAIEYNFDLDDWQKEAVIHLEKKDWVFIAAHTSAGKTVVAEYAIALAAQHMTRAIYTSPIKALSNQKFRDFQNTFGDVGLITGDVSVKPEASCLVLTTEILRSMLYQGADVIRDVEWVIFDEVHYINDSDRGVVWEEVIIMLPPHVNIIFLSATVPNTAEFADWVGRTKKRKVYVIATYKRPTPLEHHLYAGGQMHKILDSKGNFLQLSHRQAKVAFDESMSKKNKAKGFHGQERSVWPPFCEKMKQRDLLPMVAFVFSKAKCEMYAQSLSHVQYTSSNEKNEIRVFCKTALSRLREQDRSLPQVARTVDLLMRGVGVHHGGLLPIIKEMVEILFSRGLVRVLFATETFAMGVNMPARTVVFDALSKPCGANQKRDLLPGEYIQMSGRAGRRGIDKVGVVVILCWREVYELSMLKKIMTGKATLLQSQFRLTYNMILNLLRVEDLRVEDMMKRSFAEAITQKDAPEKEKKLKKIEEKLGDIEDVVCIRGEGPPAPIYDFQELSINIQTIEQEMTYYIARSGKAMTALAPGRVVFLRMFSMFGLILKTNKARNDPMDTSFHLLLPLELNQNEIETTGLVILEKNQNFTVVEAYIGHFAQITKDTIKLGVRLEPRMLGEYAEQLLQKSEKKEKVKNMHPIKDFKITDIDFTEMFNSKEKMAAALQQNKCYDCPKLQEHLAVATTKHNLLAKQDSLQHEGSEESLRLMPEFRQRLKVLQMLNYVDEGRAVLLKGRVARELNTVTCSLLATETIFDNALDTLEPEEIVAVFSCLVFEEKGRQVTEPSLTPTLSASLQKLNETAKFVFGVQSECGVDICENDYLKNINYGLMEVVYEWGKGLPFSDICTLTDIQEGTIVRCIIRLDETCRELKSAARIIGDSSLFTKMEVASEKIKRDIVFASSLYVS